MGWVFLILAGICEMFGVAMINKLHKDCNWKAFSLMFIGFAFSFFFLSLAMKTLPMGLSYAVWTGIGACGGAILGMVIYGESKKISRIFSIIIILISVVGLKIIE